MIDQRRVDDHHGPVDRHDIAPHHDGLERDRRTEHHRPRRSAIVDASRYVATRFAIMALVLVIIGIVLTYVGLLSGVRAWDASLNHTLATARSNAYDDMATFVSRRGDTMPIVAFGGLVAVTFAVMRRWRAALFVPLALLIEVATFAAVNFIVQRPRPDVETVGAAPSTYSYPSGHVAATLVCWFGVAWLLFAMSRRLPGRIVALVGSVAVAAMGWARVYLGMHHLLDVIFGIAMGVGALSIAAGALGLTLRHDVHRSMVTNP